MTEKYNKTNSKKLYNCFKNYGKEVNVETVKELLNKKANPNYITEPDSWGSIYHTFILACRKDDWIDSVRLLIEYGGDVNAQFKDPMVEEVDTPIKCAIRHDESTKEIQALLIENDAKK